ncbi:MAG: PQQ-binding-like beta-propeller repeat protein [Candidatus Stahlbacteria bacterium]|nr:PQQ-binding-like beta-propeller repeat protein [Candidatus Stahlbacteria bacterium]
MWLIYLGLIGAATIPDGWHTFRANQQRTGYIDGIGCFGDSVYEKWSLLIQNSEDNIILTSPVSADFAGDNHKDVLIGSYGTGFPTADLYNGDDGSVMWASDYSGEGPRFTTPCLMDIVGDNKPEVFLQEIESSYRFRALNGANGTGAWANNSIDSSSYCAPLALDEMYGTGGRIIVGDNRGKLWCLNATTGDSIWTYTVGNPIHATSFGNVDNDSNPEIVVVAGTMLYVFGLNGGAPKWSRNMGTAATTPALANLDGDAELEITVYNYTAGRIRSYNCGTSTPFIDVSVGVWTEDFTSGTPTTITWPPSPGLADITNDGTIDIVIHNGVNLICINGATHLVEWSTPARHLFGSPVIANLDKNDDELEIVVTGQPSNPDYRCKIQLFEHTGASKWSWGDTVTGAGYPDPSLNEACLTDVDADGYLEIVAVDYSCFLVCLDCEPVGVEENTPTTNNYQLSISRDNKQIRYYLPSGSAISLCVYDIAGREVKEIYNGYLDKGMHSATVSDLRTGIYFIRLTADGKSVSTKLTIIK